jgi:myo-inositol 2-dehydrogenase/D-chiro-inositol 1-dehydrogenase
MENAMSQKRLDRRQFLRTSATVLGAGLAAPMVSIRPMLGADAPSEKPVVAAIGVGGRGSDIGNQAAGLGKMVACADVHKGNGEGFAKGHNCELYGDYRKILDRKDIDAVTCGTPDHWHVKVACDAMQAGKDIYCEKPLTLTMAESRLVTRVAAETKRIFQVGTQQRSERSFQRAVAITRSGRLGTKLHAISSVGGADGNGTLWAPQPPPKELDWEFWLGQTAKVDFTPNRIGWNFRWWFEYSGGQVTDWGVHHTDIAVWALGADDVCAVEAEGKGTYNLGRETMRDVLLGKKPFESLPAKYNVAVQFDCNLVLSNGNTIQLVSGPNDLTIRGEKGTIVVNRGDKLVGKPIDEIRASEADKKWLDDEVAKLYRNMPQRGHMGNFFHCIKTREKPISDVWTHVNSVDACHMANIAMLLGRKVKFDPAKYEFPGDAEANAMLRRKQRDPWSNGA